MAVGSRVSDYKVGDRVMAFGWNNNFADYFKSKAFQLQPVPEGLDMDIAALGEPTSCAMYSGLNTGVQLGTPWWSWEAATPDRSSPSAPS